MRAAPRARVGAAAPAVRRTGPGRPSSSRPATSAPRRRPGGRAGTRRRPRDRTAAAALTRRTGMCEETRTTRRESFRTTSRRRSRSGAGRATAAADHCPRARRPHRRIATERIDQHDEARAVAEEDLQTDLVDELADAVEDVGRADRREPRSHDRVVSEPVPSRLQHRVADDRDRLRRVQPKAAFAPPSSELRSGEQEESLLLPGGQAHGRIVDVRSVAPATTLRRVERDPRAPIATPDPNPNEAMWRGLLDGTNPVYARTRARLKHIPGSPRCKMCAAPFGAPGRFLMRFQGHQRWEKNPDYCAACFDTLSRYHGGAELESSFLFADVRGSTTLAEGMSATDFRELLNRFYEIASRVLIENDGIIDKFVGDEAIGIFIPATAADASRVERDRSRQSPARGDRPRQPRRPVASRRRRGRDRRRVHRLDRGASQHLAERPRRRRQRHRPTGVGRGDRRDPGERAGRPGERARPRGYSSTADLDLKGKTQMTSVYVLATGRAAPA